MNIERDRLKFVGKRVMLVSATLGTAWLMTFGVDQKISSAEVQNSGPGGPIAAPTYTPYPTYTARPTETPRPDAVTIIEEEARRQVRIREALNALNPTPVSVPPPQSAPRTDVVIVHPDVVKPEVVKPEVVRVPELVRVEVPVTPVPNPEILEIPRKDFNNIVDDRVAKALTEQRDKITAEEKQKAEAEVKVAIDAAKKAGTEVETALRDARAWHLDFLNIAIGGVIGLGIGAVAFSRQTIVDRIYHHYHP